MPIYAYRCDACGFEKDVLQKLSDAPLTVCPSCGKETFKKQLTAAGFQLKGSGWYVTDFRDNKKPAGKEAAKDGAKDGAKDSAQDAPKETAKDAAGTSGTASTEKAAAPAPAPSAPAAPASKPAGST
jgi:putative FmdB family regulatory protein